MQTKAFPLGALVEDSGKGREITWKGEVTDGETERVSVSEIDTERKETGMNSVFQQVFILLFIGCVINS